MEFEDLFRICLRVWKLRMSKNPMRSFSLIQLSDNWVPGRWHDLPNIINSSGILTLHLLPWLHMDSGLPIRSALGKDWPCELFQGIQAHSQASKPQINFSPSDNCGKSSNIDWLYLPDKPSACNTTWVKLTKIQVSGRLLVQTDTKSQTQYLSLAKGVV